MATFWLGHIRKRCTATKKTHVTNTDTLTNLKNITLSDRSASREVVSGFSDLHQGRKYSFLQESTHGDGYTVAKKGAGICGLSANISSLSPRGTLQSGALSGFMDKENEAHSYQGVKLGSKPVLSLHFAVPLWSHSQPTPKTCQEHNSHTSPVRPLPALLA